MKTARMASLSGAFLLLGTVLLGAGFASCSSGDSEVTTSGTVPDMVNRALDSIGEDLDINMDEHGNILRDCILASSLVGAVTNTGLEGPEGQEDLSNLDPEVLEDVLVVIAECGKIDREILEDYEEFEALNTGKECQDSKLWARAHALRITGEDDISTRAEEISEEILECLKYDSLNRRMVDGLFPWFGWRCIFESRLYEEIKQENIRIFSGDVLDGSKKEYMPSSKWRITREEADATTVDCVDKTEFARVLRLERNSFQLDKDCTKRHLSEDPRRRSEDERQLADYLNRTTGWLPNCLIR